MHHIPRLLVSTVCAVLVFSADAASAGKKHSTTEQKAEPRGIEVMHLYEVYSVKDDLKAFAALSPAKQKEWLSDTGNGILLLLDDSAIDGAEGDYRKSIATQKAAAKLLKVEPSTGLSFASITDAILANNYGIARKQAALLAEERLTLLELTAHTKGVADLENQLQMVKDSRLGRERMLQVFLTTFVVGSKWLDEATNVSIKNRIDAVQKRLSLIKSNAEQEAAAQQVRFLTNNSIAKINSGVSYSPSGAVPSVLFDNILSTSQIDNLFATIRAGNIPSDVELAKAASATKDSIQGLTPEAKAKWIDDQARQIKEREDKISADKKELERLKQSIANLQQSEKALVDAEKKYDEARNIAARAIPSAILGGTGVGEKAREAAQKLIEANETMWEQEANEAEAVMQIDERASLETKVAKEERELASNVFMFGLFGLMVDSQKSKEVEGRIYTIEFHLVPPSSAAGVFPGARQAGSPGGNPAPPMGGRSGGGGLGDMRGPGGGTGRSDVGRPSSEPMGHVDMRDARTGEARPGGGDMRGTTVTPSSDK